MIRRHIPEYNNKSVDRRNYIQDYMSVCCPILFNTLYRVSYVGLPHYLMQIERYIDTKTCSKDT
jgi:hypothetical protein